MIHNTIKTITLILLIAAGVHARSVHYKLSMPEPQTHLYQVEMRLDGSKGTEIVAMPVWTPGSYLVREYAKNVQDFTAQSQDGSELNVTKIDKNHWKVRGKGSQDIIIKYQVYAFEHTVRTSYLNSDHGLVVPASVLMYWEKNQKREHHLKIDLPEAWSTISTSMEPFNKPGNVDFVASNYDELVDSPLELGNQHIIEFEVLGKPHILALYGASNYTDSTLIEDFTRIIEAEAKVYGGLPYEHYTFIFHLEESYGGLEHSGSSVNFINRWSFNNEKRYKRFLSLVAHEFFHLWNVKRIYPKGIASFDYDQENYLEELWVAEGFTSYYDELILQRIGLVDKEGYLKVIAKEINSLESRPGRLHQAVSESSWDTWIKFYRKNEHSRNSTISYYNKGHLLGLLLDLKLNAATQGKNGLDQVMKNLYRDFALKNKGYTSNDVKRVAEKISGLNLNKFFRDYVFGVEPLPYQEVFELAGVALDSSTEKSAYLGATFKNSSGKVVITNVAEDSPAWIAGLNVKDELLAIDGFRAKSATPTYLGEKVPGDRIICTVSRNGILRDIHLTVGYKPIRIESLKQIDEPMDSQKLVFESWLGVPWEEAETE